MSAAVGQAGPQAFGIPQLPPNATPALIAAHQQAMMIAKQTYQMAVAQQAFQAANDEWERGSTATGYGGTPSVQMPMQMGMGMQMPMFNTQMPMMNMPMNMGMGMGMMPSMFPAAPASMYAGGGGGGDGSVLGVGSQWGGGSASVYGAAFGTSKPTNGRRATGGPPPVSFPSSTSVLGETPSGLNRPRPRTKTSPSGASAAASNARNSTALGTPGRGNAPTSWRTP